MLKTSFFVAATGLAFAFGTQIGAVTRQEKAAEKADEAAAVEAPELASLNVTSTGHDKRRWPPLPENIVNVCGSVDFRKRAMIPIFKVPAKKVFVMTAMNMSDKYSDLYQRLSGKDVLKLKSYLFPRAYKEDRTFAWADSTSGIIFPPKSLVLLRRRSGRTTSQYHISGYLVDVK